MRERGRKREMDREGERERKRGRGGERERPNLRMGAALRRDGGAKCAGAL